MDVEHEVFTIAQRVAVLEAKAIKAEQDLNNIEANVHARFKGVLDGDDGIVCRVATLEKSVFKAQIYIAALSGIFAFLAIGLQYGLSLIGISLSDLTLKVKPK